MSFKFNQLTRLLSLALLYALTVDATSVQSGQPIVSLGYGSFQGNIFGNITQFLGMPFAAPPVCNLRFSPPQPPVHFNGVRNATSFGSACFQQDLQVAEIFGDLLPKIGASLALGGLAQPTEISEDCLFINVLKPNNISSQKKLPVVFWIYAGGFAVGDTSSAPGENVVSRSVALGEPVIYVSANYRINAFGFLGGKEAKAAGLGNVGLKDQRFALQWVQDYISAFGGDPSRVTLWGESAGAISVGMQMVINNGNTQGLFHAAFKDSGFPMSLTKITDKQSNFDQLVSDAGCANQTDKIACLRAVPFDKLGNAINLSPSVFGYTALIYPWMPTVDGSLIVQNPQESIRKGLYAKVPIVAGDCDDEGTPFSQGNFNITTDAEFLEYVKSNYFLSQISDEDLEALTLAYPSDPALGSPFDTGSANAITPQYKRLAAFQGDFGFQGPRRHLLQAASKTQPAYAFSWKRGKTIPILGAFHTSDLKEFYGTFGTTPDLIGTDVLVNFVNTGNPSLPKISGSPLSNVDWKQWGSSTSSPPMLTFVDPVPGGSSVEISFDTFRVDAIQLVTNVSIEVFSGP